MFKTFFSDYLASFQAVLAALSVFIENVWKGYKASIRENTFKWAGLTFFNVFILVVAGIWAAFLIWVASVFYLGLNWVDPKDASQLDKRA